VHASTMRNVRIESVIFPLSSNYMFHNFSSTIRPPRRPILIGLRFNHHLSTMGY